MLPSSARTEPRMETASVDRYAASQQQAREVLRHILEKLKDPKSKYYARYGKWAERHIKIEEFCFECILPNVWRFLNGKWNLDQMKLLGGETSSNSRGVYCNCIHGLDRVNRIYVGQAQNIRTRIGNHLNFRYRRDNPSLHYHALQRSTYNVFGILAVLPPQTMGNHTLPGMDRPDLLLNVLEIWMALLFKSLPEQTMQEWLPEGMVQIGGAFVALNIATPLDQRGEEKREWIDLSDVEDPIVRDWVDGGERQRSGVEYKLREQKAATAVRSDTTQTGAAAGMTKSRQSDYESNLEDLYGLLGRVALVGAAVFIGWSLYNRSAPPKLRA